MWENEKYIVYEENDSFLIQNCYTNDLILNDALIRLKIPELISCEVLDLQGSFLFLLCYGELEGLGQFYFVCINIDEEKIQFISPIKLNFPICSETEVSLLCENENLIFMFQGLEEEIEIHAYRMENGVEVSFHGYDRTDFDVTNLIIQYRDVFIRFDGHGLQILSEDGEVKRNIYTLSDLFDKLPNDIAQGWCSEDENELLSATLVFSGYKDYILGNGRLYLKFLPCYPGMIIAYNLNKLSIDYYLFSDCFIERTFFNKFRKQLCLIDYDETLFEISDCGKPKRIQRMIAEKTVRNEACLLDDYTIELKALETFLLYQNNIPKLSIFSDNYFILNKQLDIQHYDSMLSVVLQIQSKGNADKKLIIFIDYLKKALDGKSYFLSAHKKVGSVEAVISQCDRGYKCFNGKLYYLTNEMSAPLCNGCEREILQENDRAGIYEFSGVEVGEQKQLVSAREIKKVISHKIIYMIEISMITDEKMEIIVGGRDNEYTPVKQYLIIISMKSENIIYYQEYTE